MPRGVYVRTETHRRHLSEALKGHKVPLKTRQKISKTLTGRKCKPLSEEHKRRISETMTGKSYSEERKRNISEGRKGKYVGSDHHSWRGGVSRIPTNKRRNIALIETFRARSPNGVVGCYFCCEEITKFEGIAQDALAIHSLDGNHENWNPANKVPTHYGCHSSFHNRGEKNYHWQGDAASDKAKRRRTS